MSDTNNKSSRRRPILHTSISSPTDAAKLMLRDDVLSPRRRIPSLRSSQQQFTSTSSIDDRSPASFRCEHLSSFPALHLNASSLSVNKMNVCLFICFVFMTFHLLFLFIFRQNASLTRSNSRTRRYWNGSHLGTFCMRVCACEWLFEITLLFYNSHLSLVYIST
jgi:hypothetical protein